MRRGLTEGSGVPTEPGADRAAPERVPSSLHAHEPQPGDVISGKYQLGEIIGGGGMGSVWMAYNIPLGIDVAIKLLPPRHFTHRAADRLAREARAAARLSHPSIVRVLDFGRTRENVPYVAMELLDGVSLAQVLDRSSAVDPIVTVQTLLPVIDALRAAHAAGVVHRDLKPANIMLTTDHLGFTVPKVLDFGIAKVKEIDTSYTPIGTLLGSAEYMSPEQVQAASSVDERTDVWGATAVLYETMSGRTPFERQHYHEVIRAILSEEPTPTVALDVGDDALWTILARGLAKDREARWPDMHAFGEALARWLIDHGEEVDSTGGSLAARWLRPAPQRLSFPVESRRRTDSEDDTYY
ncbi:MAG TPA: serine/threonine-protein kinase [Polyangiaceae bacterium]|nr:serine/threonine-protein kinase [Polyangiaceae bacterium]